jgi:plasmid stabilization system protein ParE
VERIYSLEEFPTRCAVASESETLGIEVRQLLYGERGAAYRILFRVAEEGCVRVLRVRHGARDWLKPEDLEVAD